jgi:HEAT repeat protein
MSSETFARELSDPEPEARRLAAQRLPSVSGAEVCDLLLKALGDQDWRVRKEAAAAAARIERRDEVVAALVAALDEHEDIGLRNAAVEALVGIGRDALEPTIEAFSRMDADGRKLAVEVLSGIPSKRAIAALCGALGDEDSNVRATAAEGLSRAADLGEEERGAAVSALVGALSTAEVHVKLAVLESLIRLEARLPWSACEPLTRDPILKRQAMQILARSAEPAAVAALARGLEDDSSAIAREAVVALGDTIESEVDNDELLSVVRDTLRPSQAAQQRVRAFARRSEDPRARGAALATLGLVKDPEDVSLLVEALGDDEVAERAEIGLSLFGEEAVGPMLDASRTAPPPARSASISIAPMLGPPTAADVVGALREALRDGAPDVVAAALISLGRAGGEDDLARVAPFVTHADARISTVASEALGVLAQAHPRAARALMAGIGPTSPEASIGCVVLGAVGEQNEPEDLVFLRTALAHGDVRARRAAATALGAIDGEAAVDAVSFALMDEERDVVIAAVRALAKMRIDDAELVVKLSGLVDHDAWEVRKLAVEQLGRIKTGAAAQLLRSRMQVEPEAVVRAALGASLGEGPSGRGGQE